MATPVPVSELYTMADGSTPPRGSAVTFTLTAPLTDTGTGAIIPADPVRVLLDAGVLTVTLYATDDPTTSPTGVTYRADEVLGTETRSYYFALPYNGGAQVLGLLAPADIAPAVTYGISSIVANSPLSRTVASGVVTLSLDSSNFATDAELAAESSARAGADTTLTNAITAEASTARAAESATAGALTTHTGQTTDAHGGIVGSADPRLTDSRAPTAHTLAGALHTASGLTTGHVLRATGASAFAWGQPAHSDLSGISADDHHAKSHTHNADGSGTVAYSSLSGPPTIPALSSTTPAVNTLAGTAGAAATSSKSDHAHPSPWLPAMKAGDYIGPPCNVSSAVRANGTMYLSPLTLTEAHTLDSIFVQVPTTPGGTGSLTRLGIYGSGADDHPTGAALVDAGTVASTGTGILAIAINVPLAAGVYWLAAVTQGTPSPAPTYTTNTGAIPGVWADSAVNAMAAQNGYSQAGVTAGLPSIGTLASTGATIRIGVHISV